MNNKEYISELSQRCGYSLDDTQKLVRSVIESMAQRFDDGDGVSVDDFGVFEVKNAMNGLSSIRLRTEDDGSSKDCSCF